MEDGELDLLVRALKQIQEQRGYKLSGLARLLGVSTSHLSMVFAGQRRPGLRLVSAAMRRFPEIRTLMIQLLEKKTPR